VRRRAFAAHRSYLAHRKIPDYSAFSRARNERFRDSDIFRHVFERVVEPVFLPGWSAVKDLRSMRA
jgi:hypothetical protein